MGEYDSQRVCQNLAKSGNFLVLTFTKSKSQLRDIDSARPVRVKSREHWFFKVEAANRLTYRPYNAGQSVSAYKLQTEGVEEQYLEPEEGTSALQLIDQNGNDILRNDDDPWFAYHLGVVPIQGDVRVYPQIPDSQPGGVFQYLGSTRPNAVNGDQIGYFTGDDHPSWYDPQTGLSTTFAWDTGVNTDIRYQFYNENKNRRKIPKLNIFGAGYVLTPITDDIVQRNLLNAASTGDPSVTHIDWGPIRESYSYEVPDEWDAAENYIEESAPSIPEKYQPGPSNGMSADPIDVDRGDISDMSDTELADLVRGAVNNG